MSNSRSLRALLVAIFVSSMPATIILPMMPSLGTQFGINAAQLGLLVGIYPLMSMIASPMWGRLSDRYGRKPILLVSLAGGTIAFLIFGFAGSFTGLFIGRALQGLAGTPRGLGFAIIADITSPEDRSAGLGQVTAVIAAAFAIGPLVGAVFMAEDPGTLLSQLRLMLGAPANGFSHLVPSLIGATLTLIGFLVALFGFRETFQPRSRKQIADAEFEQHDRGLAHELLSLAVIIAIAMFLLSGFVQGSLQFSFALWASMVREWSAQEIAWSLAFMGSGFALSSAFLLRPLIKRIGPNRTILAGALIDMGGMSIFLLNQDFWPTALFGLFFSSIGGAFWATAILGQLSRDVSEYHQGAILGIANGAALVGRVAGPVIAGLFAERISPLMPFVLILICLTIVVLRAARMVFLPVRTRIPTQEQD